MTGTKISTRVSPHSSHGQSRNAKPSTTPVGNPSRIPPSVGQAHPPAAGLRSPNLHSSSRTPSPNYFGLAVDPASDPRSSAAGPKANWSPPTSSIRSFQPTSPQHIPLDTNPEFELFRRQTEGSHGFKLGNGHLLHSASTPGVQSRGPGRLDAQELSPKTVGRPRDFTPMELDEEEGSGQDGGLKQHSGNQQSFFDLPRQKSPSQMSPIPVQRNGLSNIDDRHPRLSLPMNKADPPSPHQSLQHRSAHHRADTLPSTLDDEPVFIPSAQLKHIMDQLPSIEILLLDLRVNNQYAVSRIKNALNLCIPPLLMKRPSFNLQKLEETFTIAEEKRKFAQWRKAEFIVVYDVFSSDKKDASSAIATLKKFTNEGWKGHSYIVKGGFAAVSKEYPKLIDLRSCQEMQTSKSSLSLAAGVPEVAPVAGGCMMPATRNPAMPFFSNIRQNLDLIGGVGQKDLQLPEELDMNALPKWLKKAAATEDRGLLVSQKFERLEIDEKSRMTKALSSDVKYGCEAVGCKDVKIAGLEKGGKNRYNNIWPFEHTRVKLHGRPEGACDYINANHIQASRSNKSYIASQGPLPATFEDFWSVIWDHDIRVIVMLTAESEGGQLKCHHYWASNEFGPYKLKSLSEKKVSLDPKIHRNSSDHNSSSEAGRRRANTTSVSSAESSPNPNPGNPAGRDEIPHVILRKFTLSHAAHPFSPMREITQIHYSSWPDFGAPAKPSTLLGLVELGDRLERAGSRDSDSFLAEDTRPVLVHCSAGCGRTGTYCTVDSVVDMLKRQRRAAASSQSTTSWLKDQDLDLIASTVEDFREQRISMVQSLTQFVLCYETILEWIAREGGSWSSSSASSNSASFSSSSAQRGAGAMTGVLRDGTAGRSRSGSETTAFGLGINSSTPTAPSPKLNPFGMGGR